MIITPDVVKNSRQHGVLAVLMLYNDKRNEWSQRWREDHEHCYLWLPENVYNAVNYSRLSLELWRRWLSGEL